MEKLILEKLDANFEIQKIFLEKDFRLRMVRVKLENAGMSPDEINKFVEESITRAKKVISYKNSLST